MKEVIRFAQTRQLIAQQAARLMAEDGIADYAFAKKKASKQLGVTDSDCLPTNAEIDEEVRAYHELFNAEGREEALQKLRSDALEVMKLLQRFDPQLTGAVLDGTAGQYAETHIHLYAESLKEVEIFLLNQQIPYTTNEKTHRTTKKGGEPKKTPMFVLEGPHGQIKLSIFEPDDKRLPTRSQVNGGIATKVDILQLQKLLAESHQHNKVK